MSSVLLKAGCFFLIILMGYGLKKNRPFKPDGSSGLLEARHEDHAPGGDHP